MANKIKVLILFQFSEHENLLRLLKVNLEKHNVIIHFFNTRTFLFSEDQNKFWIYRLFIKIPKIRTVIYFLFRKQLVLDLSKKYDVIDIHFLSTIYDDLIEKFQTKVKISFWGSDAYRITEKRKSDIEQLTNSAAMIRFNTIEMFQHMERYFKNKQKLGSQIFGNSLFDQFLNKQISKSQAKTALGLSPDKISLFIGYNASIGQQHEAIFFQLKSLPEQIKNCLQIILPLTYGGDDVKKELIIQQAIKTEIGVISFNERLSEEQIMRLRISSDIVLNFQISDAFSASLQEHFYTGSIMILADWLPYNWLIEKGLYFHKSKIEEIVPILAKIVQNFDSEINLSAANNEIIKSISSWKTVSKCWANDYHALIQSNVSD